MLLVSCFYHEMPALVYEPLERCRHINIIPEKNRGKKMNKIEEKNRSKRARAKRLSFLEEAFFEAQEKNFLIQEQRPGHKEEVQNYELDIKPVLKLEFLDVYLKLGIN